MPAASPLGLEDRLLAALRAEELLPVSAQTQSLVVRQLKTAVEDYRRTLDPAIAKQRKELKSLANALSDACAKLEDLSPQSLQRFCKAIDAPRGATSSTLREALAAAQCAANEVADFPNKEPCHALRVLAYEVARTLRDHFNIQPAATRDNTDFKVGERGGAAYARLLRKVLIATGDEPADDLYPLMDEGLALLKNPRGDLAK